MSGNIGVEGVALYDGRTLMGHAIPRGGQHEAVTAEGRSLGLYTTAQAAVNAVREAHRVECWTGEA